ncbi:hypothetical protein ERJ75_001672600 [Trypanosoma vivax]|nr:hypothetical protein ERJ75_001672600 [Trypanosoma vivax]
MGAGLKRLVDAIGLSKAHRARVVAFTDSLSLLMSLNAGPAVVEGAMIRRTWDLILRIVRLRVPVNFQFVFSHCGVPRNEAADKAAEQGNAKPQSYPAWVADVATFVERQVRNKMHRAFEEGRMPRTHRSALLDHVRPAPKHSKLDRLGASLLAQFGTGTSKHFEWLRRVLARKTDRLECRWCGARGASSVAEEERPSAETAADSASAPDLGIATGQCDPIICPL